MSNSHAAAHDSWLVRWSPQASGFSWSNPHDMNYERLPLLLPWGLPCCHVPTLATYTGNSAFPVSPFLTNFHSATSKNYYSTTTFHQQEPVPYSPLLEIPPSFPLHSTLPHSHLKGTCSFNRPSCFSLNRIRALTGLLVKNFLFWFSPEIKVHCDSNSSTPSYTSPLPWKQGQETHKPSCQ